jgi:hypothetical protein
MRLTVNGIEIPDAQDGLRIVAECSGDETMGPVTVDLSGGSLTVEHRGQAALTVTADPPHQLTLGESVWGTVAADCVTSDVTPDLIVSARDG